MNRKKKRTGRSEPEEVNRETDGLLFVPGPCAMLRSYRLVQCCG
ncbi:hypothetical protein [Schaedlerella arabinosiphila]|nr:hypothetical protein [Schaedlerella arabinosiphila]